MPSKTFALFLALFLSATTPASAAVVINEIFYHAPEDLDELQWIELHNTADQPVDLAGWSIKELAYTFPKGTSIAPGGYLVLAHDPRSFAKYYPANKALGPTNKPLSRSGSRLELLDATGHRADLVRYKDHAPWPAAADGYSASLERICPTSSGEAPENWAASPLPLRAPKPSGTPGQLNTAFSKTLPPIVNSLTSSSEDPAPGKPLRIDADVKNPDTLASVRLTYRILPAGAAPATNIDILMTRNSATGHYTANIPAQKANTLLRYRIKVTDKTGVSRFYPDANDIRPAQSLFVHDPWPADAPIPFGLILHNRSVAAANGLNRIFGGNDGSGEQPRPRGAPPQPHPPRGGSTFVYVEPKTGKATLFDYVNIIPRTDNRGYKVHFHKGQFLRGMSTVSIIFEGDERYLLAESLAYDVYRRAGNAAPRTEFIRLFVDARMTGYHLLIEDPNKAFLRNNHLRDDGNLYKLIWYGGGLVGQHEKRTYPQTGHDDLIALVNQLDHTKGDDARWKLIQDNFDVNQVATYFAVNMVLSHWDGFFNNYFTYHDVHGTGKWTMYPWDQDKTWGFYDGIGRDETFFNMPLTFGMEGDPPPGGGGGPFGGGATSWWRAGGFFSRPLLANPQFRKIFLQKTRDILENVYTQQIYFPQIDNLAKTLHQDVELRAKLNGQDPKNGLDLLAHNVKSLKAHLEKRREWLLDQPELRNLKPTTKATAR
jgi:spore coat protein CotH